MEEETVDNVEAPEVAVEEAAPEVVEAPAKFYDSWEDDLKSSPSLQKFKDEQAIFRSYTELEKLNGYKGDIPAPDADEEDWQAFYKKMGVRDEASEYEINSPEGFEIGDDHLNKFKELAKQYNITPKQEGMLNDMLGYYAELEIQAQKEADSQYEEAVEGLKKEWGDEYVERSADVKHYQAKLGLTEEEAEAINANPAAVRAFYISATKSGEQPQVGTQYGTTQAGIQAQIESLEADLVDVMTTEGARSPKIAKIQDKLFHMRSKKR